MSKRTLDHDTLQAVGVLARAVEQARMPGVLEFRLLSNALNRAIETRGERDLHEAARVFQTLDRDCRERIVERANAMAHAEAAGGRRPSTAPVRSITLPSLGKAARSATGFLAALNGGRSKPSSKAPAKPSSGPTESRNAAKSRLMEAVERQREAASDFLPGEPLPRSAWTP
ncbi:hypothetical protein [Azospirillum soli]|uniref:hypothetical protein n=1 Tax=Azospirillum soli TaxID=1304799 RepID=UPI001AE628FD|nr:hypothetical protein [Azospirillum soli]MBP2314620.1 hypothetical protein [Azospirillum soli]